MQNLWILQVNPQHLDLALWIDQIQHGQQPAEGTWRLSRFWEHVHAGDILWFWQSGEGLVAQGECLTNAYRAHEDPEFNWEFAYRLTHHYHPTLSRQAFQTLDFVAKISFFKRPQGQVFKTPPDQTQALLNFVAPHRKAISTHPAAFWPDISHRIRKQGLALEDRSLRQYHMALQSQSLVIITGRSGIGKSWLTHAYAQATGAAYLLVPVAPNWVGPEDLLGYYNAVSDRFMPTVSSQFIAQAAQEWHLAQREQRTPRAYHLVLDEMNLARTEAYFAPLLSLLEVRRRGEHAFYQRLGAEDLEIPPNLVCIGTANTEAQALHFSERLADRAFVLSLSPDPIQFVHLHAFFEAAVIAAVKPFWEALNQCHPLSYRTLSDLQSYLHQARVYQVPLLEALDEALAQKVFHRLVLSSPQRLYELHQALPEHFPLSHAALAQQRQGSIPFYPEP